MAALSATNISVSDFEFLYSCYHILWEVASTLSSPLYPAILSIIEAKRLFMTPAVSFALYVAISTGTDARQFSLESAVPFALCVAIPNRTEARWVSVVYAVSFALCLAMPTCSNEARQLSVDSVVSSIHFRRMLTTLNFHFVVHS